jgi:hypothetical protein
MAPKPLALRATAMTERDFADGSLRGSVRGTLKGALIPIVKGLPEQRGQIAAERYGEDSKSIRKSPRIQSSLQEILG